MLCLAMPLISRGLREPTFQGACRPFARRHPQRHSRVWDFMSLIRQACDALSSSSGYTCLMVDEDRLSIQGLLAFFFCETVFIFSC